jgi:hypothetical protein
MRGRDVEAGVLDGGADTVAGFADGGVWKTDGGELRIFENGAGEVHFDVDDVGVDAVDNCAAGCEEHCLILSLRPEVRQE